MNTGIKTTTGRAIALENVGYTVVQDAAGQMEGLNKKSAISALAIFAYRVEACDFAKDQARRYPMTSFTVYFKDGSASWTYNFDSRTKSLNCNGVTVSK